MTNEELQKLREQVTASALLSQIEKAEWMQLLPEMNDAQTAELASILQSAIPQPKPQATPQTPPPANQKDLPVGVQLAALESGIAGNLPEPHPVPPPVPTPPPAPKKPIVHERPAWQTSIAHQPMATPAVPSVSPGATPTAAHAAPTHAILTQSIQKPEDLQKLDVQFLRQGDPKIVLNNLLNAVVAMLKKYPVTDIAGKIELSPLYKTYYASGLSGLNSGTLAPASSPTTLSKEEFEAFTDFRLQMGHVIS